MQSLTFKHFFGLAVKPTASAACEKYSFPYLILYVCLKKEKYNCEGFVRAETGKLHLL